MRSAVRIVQTDYNGLTDIFAAAGESLSVLEKRFERYNSALAGRQRHYLILDDLKIVAMSATTLEQQDDGPWLRLWHVSVDADYRGCGYARDLLRAVFADADALTASLVNNGFSSDLNRERLGGCMAKIHADYPDMTFFPDSSLEMLY